jgi:hypothetical protein
MPTDAPVSPVFHIDGLTEVDGHASTRWDEYGNDQHQPPSGNYDPNQGKWRIPTDRGSYLNDGDPYFQHIQAAAQTQYGDPNIHYAETGTNGDKHRYLAFGNGQALPQDGTIVYRADDDYFKRNADGTVTRWIPDSKDTGHGHLDGAPLHTEARQLPNGTWALFDPTTNKQVTAQSTTRPGDNPPPPPPADPKRKEHKGVQSPLQSAPTTIPDGMVAPTYPDWASQSDPDVGNQLTGVVARLYNLFGSGTPASSSVPDFPFNTDTGTNSGIDNYDALRGKFKALETEFTSTAKSFNQAVESSKVTTEQGRKAINDAINDFNTKTGSLSDGSWDGLLQAETNLIDSAKDAVQKAAGTSHDVPANPDPGPGTPAPSAPIPDPGPAPDPGTDPGKSGIDKLLDKLGGGMPLGGMPGMGGMNPLGGLGGMNPLGGGGQGISPMGGGTPAPAASRLPDPGNDPTKPAVTPLNPPAPPGVPTPTPAAAGGPSADPSGNGSAGPVVVPAGNAGGTGTTVSLPDGKTVDAPNTQAAKAATNAITNASPGGDPAQKAYSGVMDLPGDGKNPGAKVDPGDMQAGDVLKWQDKTMVAAGPGLVADPTHPGTVHQLQDVLKDGKGFQGIFRPTAVDPTLTAHSAPPPVVDVGDQHPAPPPAAPPPAADIPDHSAPPAAPAPSTIPLASPAPPPPAADPGAAGPQAVTPAAPAGQPAPPSPFAPHTAPPATRSTKADRTAAGTD